jgi:hypothetical protein
MNRPALMSECARLWELERENRKLRVHRLSGSVGQVTTCGDNAANPLSSVQAV